MVRRVAVAGALAASVALLSGCGTGVAGDAATSTAFRVGQDQVADDVAAVLQAQGMPTAEPPVGLAVANVQRLVQGAVIAAKAAELDIRVSDGQVDRARDDLAEERFGGIDGLRAAALQSGIPPEGLDDAVRSSLEVEAIGAALAPDGDAAARNAAAQQALAEYSDAIDVEVAPRYGTWDDATLTIVLGSPVAGEASVEPVEP